MESNTPATSTRLKQRVIIELLIAEKVKANDIHHRLNIVYGGETVDISRLGAKEKPFFQQTSLKPILRMTRVVCDQILVANASPPR